MKFNSIYHQLFPTPIRFLPLFLLFTFSFTLQVSLADEQMGQSELIDISGTWRGEGYTCINSPVPAERIGIAQNGAEVVATKIIGDDCVESGQITWVTSSFPSAIGIVFDVEVHVEFFGFLHVFVPGTGILIDANTIEITADQIPSLTFRREYAVTHVEFTQAIQTEGNNVPLISNKPTLVRVFVECYWNCEEPITGTVLGTNGTPLPMLDKSDAFIALQTDPWQTQRSDLDKSLNFRIPDDQAVGAYDLTILVQGTSSVYKNISTEKVMFTLGKLLKIGFIAVALEGHYPNPLIVADGDRYISTVFPTSSTQYEYVSIPSGHTPSSVLNNLGNGRKTVDKGEMFNFLYRIFIHYDQNGWPENIGRPDQLYGWVPESIAGYNGAGYNGGRVAYGSDNERLYHMTMAHEIAHNYGRPHPCMGAWVGASDYSIGDVGFDFGVYATNQLVDKSTDDYMTGGHCGKDVFDDKWTSAFTFNSLFTSLISSSHASELRPFASEKIVVTKGQPSLMVSGEIINDNSAIFEQGYKSIAANDVVLPTGTDYCLILENDAQVELVRRCFDLIHYIDEETGEEEVSSVFTYLIPFDAQATRLVLKRDNVELAERIVSDHSPTVTLLSPNGGVDVSGMVNVTWSANDADGDDLHYTLYYSHDNGESWYHLGFDLTETEMQVDTSRLPGGNQALFKITATDGINTTSDTSDAPFSVPTHSPTVRISFPKEDVEIHAGELIYLRGIGSDLEDGIHITDSLEWTSDRDGVLGTGKKIDPILSAGEHLITLSATDSDGNRAEAYVRVNVISLDTYLPLITNE